MRIPWLTAVLAWAIAGALVVPLASAGAARAAEPVLEDAVAIEIVDREVLAFIELGGPFRLRLQKDERVLSQAARGRVGVVATDRRLLAASPGVGGWVEAPLQLSETQLSYQVVRGRIALFTTERRVLAFDSELRLWLESKLAQAEPVIDVAAGQSVAVAVTPYRALGFAPGLGGTREFRLRLGEELESLTALAALATLRTDQRLLLFRGESGSWRVESLPLE